eukprot:TRINITY_DN2672_c0_g1_i1.p1 TRINITY_DN2672_c0_g1~~TRINITY_DN2672_c0_g1_i1.p1  ORF type:complete len:225 (-),score=68.24 TRINITY_DN2672_c0_g1_i1:126-770(-)
MSGEPIKVTVPAREAPEHPQAPQPKKAASEKVPSAPRKRVVDAAFLALVDQKIVHCSEAAAAARAKGTVEVPTSVVEELLQLEKHARNAEDVATTSKIALCLLSLFWDAKDWRGLNDNIQLLAKRRGQLKTVIQNVVQKASVFVEQMTEPALRSECMRLIETLRAITEGKIYVELERARLTKLISSMHEESGDIKVASKLLQEIQVPYYLLIRF